MSTLEKRIEGLGDQAEIERGERELAEFATWTDAELDEHLPALLDRACKNHNAEPEHPHPHTAEMTAEQFRAKDRIAGRMAALGYRMWHDKDNIARWTREQSSNAT